MDGGKLARQVFAAIIPFVMSVLRGCMRLCGVDEGEGLEKTEDWLSLACAAGFYSQFGNERWLHRFHRNKALEFAVKQ